MLESLANAIVNASKTLENTANETEEKTLNEETDNMNPKWQHHLTGALHQELDGRRYYNFTRLPRSHNDFTEVFHSRSDCQKTINQNIKLAWDTAARLMDPDSGKCLAYPAAEFYTELLENLFTDNIEYICTGINRKKMAQNEFHSVPSFLTYFMI